MHGFKLGFFAMLLGLMTGPLFGQEAGPIARWNVTLGVAALLVPSYPGSDEFRVLPIPLAQVTFRERLFLGPSTTGPGGAAGGYLIRSSRVGLMAEASVQDKRPASRADALAGMDDRDVVATVGTTVTYRVGSLEGALGVTRGLNDGAGFLGTGRVRLSQICGRLMIRAGAGATLADVRQMRREFGVTDGEARRRQSLIDAGDDRIEADEGRAYRPSGGLRHLGASLMLGYLLSDRWSLLGFGGVDRLGGEAVGSPLMRRREQFSMGVGLSRQL
jgi:outer membrane protein